MSAGNDNNGPYILGPDPNGDAFDRQRIKDAQHQVLLGLRDLLQSGGEPLCALLKRGHAWDSGLTNGETILAVLKALSAYQLEVLHKFSGMNFDSEDDGDDDEGGDHAG